METSSPASPPLPVWPCESCGYNLHGTRDTVCPECGRVFDSSEFTAERLAELHATPTRWVSLALLVGQFSSTLLPIICYVWARLQLGRWPRPSLDDPKGIDGVRPLSILWGVSMLFILAVPNLLALQFLRWWIEPSRSRARRTLQWWVLASLIAWPLSAGTYWLLGKYTPILEWLWD